MKRAIKLLVLAGALLSVGALAQANQTWKFGFPSYYFIYTNTESVNFDFTATLGDASVVYNSNQATINNLESCIETIVNTFTNNNEPVAQQNQPTTWTSFGTCEFGPTSVTSSGYSVDWNGLGSADGSLLVVTNASSYKVTVHADSVPAGVTYKVAAAFGDASSISFINIPVGASSASGLADDSNDYFTQYQNVYVIPLTFAAEVEPTTSATGNTATTTVVTYTASAP